MDASRKISIKDVAKRAGVSTATVSHVVNKTRYVKEDTARRVLDAIAELNYSPNTLARSFRTGVKKTVGVITPDISNRLFSALIESIESTLSQLGYHLIIANTKETEHREQDHLRYFCSGIVDGLIVIPATAKLDNYASIIPERLPVVFADRVVSPMPWDSVVISNAQPIMQSVKALARLGHQKIGYIAGASHLSTTTERLRGYTDAMDELSLLVGGDFIQYCAYCNSSHREEAIACLKALLAVGCTAAVISTGAIAHAAVLYCQDNGVAIGKDVDFVCFSDESNTLAHSKEISIITQPVYNMGRRVGEQIVQRINNVEAPVKEIVLEGVFWSNAVLTKHIGDNYDKRRTD